MAETAPAEWDTLAGRLRWAIERQPRHGRMRGLRLFVRRVGAPLSSVQSYVRESDPVTPPLEFVERAARVLEVRAAWLGFEDGWPTEAERAAVRDAVGLSTSVRDAMGEARNTLAAFDTTVRRSLGRGIPGFWQLPHASRASIIRGYGAYWRLPSTLSEFGDQTPGESYRRLVARFARYLAAPFDILRIPRGELSPSELALIIEALMRPLDIARWAAQPEETEV